MSEKTKEGSSNLNIPQKKYSRREFGKKAALLTAAVTTGTALVTGPTLTDVAESLIATPSLEKEITKNQNFIKQRYSIDIDFSPEEGTSLTTAEIRDVLEWSREELAKYPLVFFRHFFTLKRIQIFNDAHVGNEVVGGYVDDPGSFDLTNPAYRQVDRIVVAKKIGLLNIYNNFGWTNANFFRRTVHHELVHFTDFFSLVFKEEGGAGNWPNSKPGDPFSGYIGDEYKSLELRYLFSNPPGFARVYGMKGVLEDRATVAELLLTDPKRLEGITTHDSLLAKKVNDLKQRFYKISHGKMDEQYWQDLEQGKVKEGYWDRKDIRK